jgi:hypothetical protein
MVGVVSCIRNEWQCGAGQASNNNENKVKNYICAIESVNVTRFYQTWDLAFCPVVNVRLYGAVGRMW